MGSNESSANGSKTRGEAAKRVDKIMSNTREFIDK
jgi:hypothetical protein